MLRHPRAARTPRRVHRAPLEPPRRPNPHGQNRLDRRRATYRRGRRPDPRATYIRARSATVHEPHMPREIPIPRPRAPARLTRARLRALRHPTRSRRSATRGIALDPTPHTPPHAADRLRRHRASITHTHAKRKSAAHTERHRRSAKPGTDLSTGVGGAPRGSRASCVSPPSGVRGAAGSLLPARSRRPAAPGRGCAAPSHPPSHAPPHRGSGGATAGLHIVTRAQEPSGIAASVGPRAGVPGPAVMPRRAPGGRARLRFAGLEDARVQLAVRPLLTPHAVVSSRCPCRSRTRPPAAAVAGFTLARWRRRPGLLRIARGLGE